jgi:hypothetical protein
MSGTMAGVKRLRPRLPSRSRDAAVQRSLAATLISRESHYVENVGVTRSDRYDTSSRIEWEVRVKAEGSFSLKQATSRPVMIRHFSSAGGYQAEIDRPLGGLPAAAESSSHTPVLDCCAEPDIVSGETSGRRLRSALPEGGRFDFEDCGEALLSSKHGNATRWSCQC